MPRFMTVVDNKFQRHFINLDHLVTVEFRQHDYDVDIPEKNIHEKCSNFTPVYHMSNGQQIVSNFSFDKDIYAKVIKEILDDLDDNPEIPASRKNLRELPPLKMDEMLQKWNRESFRDPDPYYEKL